jgi:hypothetical protein
MDPVSTAIITVLNTSISDVVRDAYNALKRVLQKKFGKDSDMVDAVENLEKKPKSTGRQETLREEIESAKADQDEDILKAVRMLQAKIDQNHGGEKHSMNARGNYIAQADHGSTATVTVGKE